MNSRTLIAVIGPTASGKSDLAVFLALELGGEIVNCDSLQVYRYFDIGTAKIPLAERHGVPHHLLDVLDPQESFSAGEYARRARETIEQIAARGKVPVVAGGTGFYLRALLEGLFPGPQRNEDLRERLRRRAATRPAGYLHGMLARLDPGSAERIHANDTPKLIRALEVCFQARRPMSAMFQEGAGHGRLEGFGAIKIGLNPPRPALYDRINRRTRKIFEAGLVEEVKAILERGIGRDVKAFESQGYPEALAVIGERMTVEEAVAATQLRSRRYAKRQMTWFRREQDVHWLAGFGDDPAIQRAALDVATGS